ncbi:MAG: family 16 glycosylhydrolase [Salibacteraceae bacterium]
MLLVLLLGLGLQCETSIAQCNILMWQDEFDGNSLDLTKWSYQTGDGCPDLCGWGNNELQHYTDRNDNVSVANGMLTITALQESFMGSDYTSGRIRTIGKGEWTGGRIEARMKLPTGQGLWPAFWMLPTDSYYGGWPLSGEIDIMEIRGHEDNIQHGTIHFGPLFPANAFSGTTYTLPSGSFSTAFHDFALEWEKDELRWYVDGALFATKKPNSLSGNPWRFDRDFHLLLNVAVGGWFPGNPDPSTQFPQTMEVDWVRVYQNLQDVFITGKERLPANSTSQIYSVPAFPNATYTWTAPSGATIVSGQGTREVVVDWGGVSGSMQVEIDNGGCNAVLDLPVEILPLVCKNTILNFETVNHVYWTGGDGVYTENVVNPGSNSVNASTSVASYERNPAVQYSTLIYSIDLVGNSDRFINGKLAFELDVYTDASVGTEILVQLEDNIEAYNPYPSGRHSVYQAFTSVQNEWETMRFNFTMQPDGSLSDEDINQLLFLFHPNSNSGTTFWFDNLRIVDTDCAGVGLDEILNTQAVSAFPNPFVSEIQLNFNGLEAVNLQLFTATGQLVKSMDNVQPSQSIPTHDLPAGVYILHYESATENGQMKLIKYE